MNLKRLFCFLLGLLLTTATAPSNASPAILKDPTKEMTVLLSKLHTYALKQNPSFQLLGNGSLDLFSPETLTHEDRGIVAASLDGVLFESYFYGWEMKDDAATPPEVHLEWSEALKAASAHHLPLFNIDYCSTTSNVASSYKKNQNAKIVSFAAPARNLTRLPSFPEKPFNENDSDIRKLQQVRNFMILLNPEEFSSRQAYLDELRKSAFDLLIIDATFNGSALTLTEINSLKHKPQGGKRLVFAYLSIGEAETYRKYWQQSWQTAPPDWLAEKNPDWDGNFKVHYWEKEWHDILFGTKSSQLDLIIAAGFDGSMLDVVDAYQYYLSD